MTTISPLQLPYVSIIDSATAATMRPETPDLIANVTQNENRSGVSISALSRLRAFDAGNNRLVNYLQPIDDAEAALEGYRDEMAAIKELAEQALSLKDAPASAPPATTTPTGTPAPPRIEARTSVTLTADSPVEGAGIGMRLSISSDNGEDFIFTFTGSTTTWGEIVEALNSADMGVRARFDVSADEGSRLVIESSDGHTGFRINGASSRQVVDDLVGITSPYDGGYAASRFSDGAETSRVIGGAGPLGLSFGAGASLIGMSGGTIAAGTSLRFVGADGTPRKWVAEGPTSARAFMLDINAMRSSVVAEMTAAGALRLRDTQGGDVTIGAATGSFAAGQAMAFTREIEAPPQPGLPADAIAARASAQIDRDTLVAGATNGMRLSLWTDEGNNFTYTFGMEANTVTWGQIADQLDAAKIGVKIRFDESRTGTSRMTLYSVDNTTGFRIDGASSRQVVDDLFGISSPYDGAFRPEMFADGATWPEVGVAAREQGMTFGRGAALQTLGVARPISSGSSISFIDGDGIQRTWVASGSNTSPITMIEGIKAMHADVLAELTPEGTIRLRSTDGRSIQMVSATGDFDPEAGELRLTAQVAPPENAPERTTQERIASLGRILNGRMQAMTSALGILAYNKGVATNELLTSANTMNAATPWGNWADSRDSIVGTRDALIRILDSTDTTLAQLKDRQGTLHAMALTYTELGNDLKHFATEMLDSYLTRDEARAMASQIQSKLTSVTAGMGPDQARDLLLLLG